MRWWFTMTAAQMEVMNICDILLCNPWYQRFANERSHKQRLLDEALLSPDFILWLDADEVLTANAADYLQSYVPV